MDLLACPMCKNFPLELYVLVEKRHEDRKLPGEPPLCELYCGYLRKEMKSLSEKPPCEECIKHEVLEGALYCSSCGRWFPIIDTIPHMLPDDIRKRERSRELEFLEKHKASLPEKIVRFGRPHNLAGSA